MEENFEKILGDQFDNHTEKVDDQVVWEGIMERMQPKRKRRVIAWWKWSALAVVSVLVIVGVFFLLNQESQKHAPIANEISEPSIKTLNLDSPNTENQMIIDNNDVGAKNQISKSVTEVQTDIEIEKKREQIELESKDAKGTTEEKSEAVKLRDENSNFSFDRIIAQNKKSQIGSITRTLDIVKGQDLPEKLNVNIINREIEERSSLEIPIVEKVKDGRKERLINVLDLPFYLKSKKESLLGSPLLVIKEEKKQVRKFHLFSYMGLYTSIDFGGAELNSSTLDSDYTEMISSNLTLMEKVGFGIDLNVFKYKGLTFSSGIGLEQLTDRFSWTGSYIEEKEGEYIESVTQFVDGSISDEIVTGSIPWEFTKVINYYDDRFLITVPLMIGYEMKRQNHRFGVSAGLDMKYQSGHTSLLLNDMGIPTKYDLDGKWLDPSLRLTGEYGYFINTNWSVGLGLSLSKLQSEYGIDPSSSNINYDMIGTRLSIRYHGF